jgi:hypothetical protein
VASRKFYGTSGATDYYGSHLERLSRGEDYFPPN